MNRLTIALQRVSAFPARAWDLLRALSGDDSYQRYLGHSRDHHAEVAPLDRRRFYLSEQERRFSGGPTRCC